jgi:hypothetical protein
MRIHGRTLTLSSITGNLSSKEQDAIITRKIYAKNVINCVEILSELGP